MLIVKGRVVGGMQHFTARMKQFPEVFRRATGENLVPGTLNVDVGREIPVREHFRIRGVEIGEPEQDLQFEVCRINGLWAYRIRPFHLPTGLGGWGDCILEITCSKIVDVGNGAEIELFREETGTDNAANRCEIP